VELLGVSFWVVATHSPRIRVILYDLRASVVNKAFILSKIEKDCAMPVS
jgi:hypothetical protein